MNLNSYMLLAPEALLVVAACVALFLDGRDRVGRAAAWLGFGASLGAAALALLGPTQGLLFNGMLYFGGYTPVARAAVAALTAVWCLAVAGKSARTPASMAVALSCVRVAIPLCRRWVSTTASRRFARWSAMRA